MLDREDRELLIVWGLRGLAVMLGAIMIGGALGLGVAAFRFLAGV